MRTSFLMNKTEENCNQEMPPGMKFQIKQCPYCGEELENVFLDEDNSPVYVDFEESSITPIYITDQGIFSLLNDCNMPNYCDHFELFHTH